MTSKLALAADIGGGHISAAVVDLSTGGVLLETCADANIDSKGASEQILDAWARVLNTALEKVDPAKVAGIGFAMPGPFDYRSGTAHFGASDKYESLCGLVIEDALSPRLRHAFAMRFVNDATAFGIGEARRLEAAQQSSTRVIAVTLGTGFGSAFLEHGVPVTNSETVPLHGCLWHLPFQDGVFDDYISVRWLRAQFSAIRDDQPVPGVHEIAEIARQDKRCAAIFEQYGRHLGSAVADWIVRFDAGALVIGGNIVGAYDLFAPSLHDALDTAGAKATIVISENTDRAAIAGAARLFEDSFWARVKGELPTS